VDLIDRKILFDSVRHTLFYGKLTTGQVQGIDAVLDGFIRFNTSDMRHQAYILATAYHETGRLMQPIREGFKLTDKEARAYVSRNRYKYSNVDPVTWQVYYGRGLVQLTWVENYRKMGSILGIDLYHYPDRALESRSSVDILIEGMTRGATDRGDFTGKALEDYFGEEFSDPINARRIVNGTDRAELVSTYYFKFLEALKKATYELPTFLTD